MGLRTSRTNQPLLAATIAASTPMPGRAWLPGALPAAHPAPLPGAVHPPRTPSCPGARGKGWSWPRPRTPCTATSHRQIAAPANSGTQKLQNGLLGVQPPGLGAPCPAAQRWPCPEHPPVHPPPGLRSAGSGGSAGPGKKLDEPLKIDTNTAVREARLISSSIPSPDTSDIQQQGLKPLTSCEDELCW